MARADLLLSEVQLITNARVLLTLRMIAIDMNFHDLREVPEPSHRWDFEQIRNSRTNLVPRIRCNPPFDSRRQTLIYEKLLSISHSDFT